MRRILVVLVAALGLALASGTALAQHRGGHSGGGHSGGWHGGGHSGGWHGGGHGWHGGSHFALGIGFPGFYWGGWGYPYYASYPYYTSYPYYAPYYYGDEAVYESAPSTYIQRDMNSGPSSAAPAGESQYLYYCTDPAGYYPQLQACPKGWLKVIPDSGPRPRTR